MLVNDKSFKTESLEIENTTSQTPVKPKISNSQNGRSWRSIFTRAVIWKAGLLATVIVTSGIAIKAFMVANNRELILPKIHPNPVCNATAAENYNYAQKYVEKIDSLFFDYKKNKKDFSLSDTRKLSENALYYFELAADQAHIKAHYHVADMYDELDFRRYYGSKKSFHHYKMAADHGYAPAQNMVGALYQNYAWKFATNMSYFDSQIKALQYYKKAADQGYTIAQINLADVYFSNKDYSKCCQYLRRAIQNIYFRDMAQIRLYGDYYSERIQVKTKDDKLSEFC